MPLLCDGVRTRNDVRLAILTRIACRFVEGGSLHETMKKFGAFPEELLVLYVAQVLQGLEYLHSQNVVHR